MFRRKLVLTIALSALLAACSTETETVTVTVDGPIISIDGRVAVLAGETVSLTASTENGTDASYAWASSDGQVVTVDDNGVVTGSAEGEVTIYATGSDTGKVGAHKVVIARPAATSTRSASLVKISTVTATTMKPCLRNCWR